MTQLDDTDMPSTDKAFAVAATSIGLLAVLVLVTQGVGAAMGILGLAAIVAGAWALVSGRVGWARIASRRAAAAVAVGGFLVMATGAAMSPHPETQTTAADTVVPPSSEALATTSPAPSAVPQPLVAAPTTTASQAPVLPPAPTMTITCPSAGSGSSPVYGQQISATAPYSVSIDYGDGDAYANDDQHLAAIFSHTYAAAGSFTVTAVLTDAVGQTTSSTCTYSWTAPAPLVNAGGGSGGSSAGGGVNGGVAPAPSGGGSPVYQNCDAVRAAGAAPIHAGDPGWQSKFDRDGDGIGCE